MPLKAIVVTVPDPITDRKFIHFGRQTVAMTAGALV